MKTTLLCAASLALMTGAASAASQTVIQLDGFCDTYTITHDGANVGMSSTQQDCDPGIGSGYIGKVKAHGKYADLGSILNGDPGSHWVIGLQWPLVTGGSFTFGFTTDGINIGNDILTGTYSVVGTAAQGPRGTKSATSAIKNK
ncbi:MAG: hypothetical protein JOZ72_15040 [Alphaproteobacteria bacterium]|nr:hypothetical protein [Alphaproteobacteria bacterium]